MGAVVSALKRRAWARSGQVRTHVSGDTPLSLTAYEQTLVLVALAGDVSTSFGWTD